MAKKEGGNAGAAGAGGGGGGGNNVVSLHCCVEKCGKKADRMNFCTEHYAWFKEGLVNKAGQKPTDFDKKFQAFMTRKSAA